MADKPAAVPEWATDGSADNVEPSSGKKAIGWLAGEHPPNSYLNYWMNLVYQFCLYIYEGVLSGLHVLTVGRADDDDPAPVFLAVDPDSRVRTFIDPFGYIGGNWTQANIVWGTHPTDATALGATTSNVTKAVTAANASLNAPHVQFQGLDVSTSTGDGSSYFVNVGWFYDRDNTCFVLEFILDIELTGSTYAFYVGMHSSQDTEDTNPATGSSHSYFLVGVNTADANLKLFVGDGSAGSSVSLGAIPAQATHVRLEYHGAGTTLGVENSDATVRVFLDGVQAVEHIGTNVPTGTEALGFMVFGGDVAGGSGFITARVGPVRATWNPFLAGHTLSLP